MCVCLCQVTLLTSLKTVRDLPLEVILDCVFTTFLTHRSGPPTSRLTVIQSVANVSPPVLYL